jgi:hypothetical protein
MNSKIKLALLTCVSMNMIGCARLSGGSEDEQVFLRDNEIALRVINQNYYDARLFARWRNGRRVSIGHVTGFNERTFTFRWEYYDLQVEINLLSVGVHVTPWMNVEHGDELELVIDPSLDKRIGRGRP